MPRIDYKLSVAGWSVDSSADPRTELVELDVLHVMGSPAGHCELSVFAPAGGGAGANVRGHALAAPDPMTIALSDGRASATVATASLQSFEASLELVRLVGRTGLRKLAETRVNQVYENQSLGQIVRDLASQASVTVGDVAQGGRYHYLVVHESRSVLRTVLDLAAREGMDVYCDRDDRLVVKAFQKAAPDHVLRYGTDILALSVRDSAPVAERVRVYGESPASSSGADTWHWLVSDLSSYRGDSGSGSRMRVVQDGAVRTKAAADAYAGARVNALRDRATHVRVAVLGRPGLQLGEGVQLRDVPGAAPGGVLKVRSVRHVLNRRDGYLTIAGLVPHSAGVGL